MIGTLFLCTFIRIKTTVSNPIVKYWDKTRTENVGKKQPDQTLNQLPGANYSYFCTINFD